MASGRWMAMAALAAALACGAGCVHEIIEPVTESTLVVARSSDKVVLSWTATAGMYYTLLYAESQGADAEWKALDRAVNLRAKASGPVEIVDHVQGEVPRYYRLIQDAQPIPLER